VIPLSGASGTGVDWVLDKLLEAIGPRRMQSPGRRRRGHDRVVAGLMRRGAKTTPPSSCPRLIVKIGSALLVDQDGDVRRAWLEADRRRYRRAHAAGQQVAVVSSGAIALGARRLKLPKGGRASLEDAQAAAATGPDRTVAGLGRDAGRQRADRGADAGDARRSRETAAAISMPRRRSTGCSSLGVVPVLNENDSVATEEIRFGDNDRLAARVAQAAGAQGVVLLSDVDGLYDRNPALPGAQHIARIERIDAAIEAMADKGSASGMGSGGMVSKIAAARIANAAGAHLAIASGRVDGRSRQMRSTPCSSPRRRRRRARRGSRAG
jgi:glutamate 5-kinase